MPPDDAKIVVMTNTRDIKYAVMPDKGVDNDMLSTMRR